MGQPVHLQRPIYQTIISRGYVHTFPCPFSQIDWKLGFARITKPSSSRNFELVTCLTPILDLHNPPFLLVRQYSNNPLIVLLRYFTRMVCPKNEFEINNSQNNTNISEKKQPCFDTNANPHCPCHRKAPL